MKKFFLAFGFIMIGNVSANFCPLEYAPVCAENGQTYANTCTAQADNQAVVSEGRCNSSVTSPSLLPPTFVITPEETPEKTPQVGCANHYIPVCGENLKTYTNICHASEADQEILYRGRCLKDEEPLEPIEECVDQYQPVCGENGQTYRNSCKAKEFGVFNFSKGVCSQVVELQTPLNLCKNESGEFVSCSRSKALRCDFRFIEASYDPLCKVNQ